MALKIDIQDPWVRVVGSAMENISSKPTRLTFKRIVAEIVLMAVIVTLVALSVWHGLS